MNPNGKEELWVLSNRFQKSKTDTMNPNEVNFRIQNVRIDELLNGDECISWGSYYWSAYDSHYANSVALLYYNKDEPQREF